MASENAHDQPDTQSDPYAQIAEWYDLEHDGFAEDSALYLDELGGERTRLAILEVGAGTGRLMAPLAVVGHTVTGVEPSAAMRARGERRFAALPERVARRLRLVEGSATDLRLPADERFDVALLGLGALNHLATLDERLTALGALHARLKPGARLLLDADIAGPRRLLETAGQVWWQGAWPARGGRLTVAHLLVGRPGATPGVVEVTHLYDAQEADGTLRRIMTTTPLALLTRGEVELALRQAGFGVEALYGGYDLAPADDASPRLIALARRG